VSLSLPIPAIQALQVLTVAGAAPGVSGVIARAEARLQGRRGPRVLQPYYDLAKLFRKESLAPEGASWVFLAAPLAAFACYLTVPLLIPVLTSYPLPLGYMGDILGGGFILSLASFLVATAALETGSPYAQPLSIPPADTVPDSAAGTLERPGPQLGYTSDVVEVTEAYFYRPLLRPIMATVRAAKRLQSGRLDAYLAYMLIALVALLALVSALA
jgi:NADH dehydrogenase